MSLPQSFKDYYLQILPKKIAEEFFAYSEKPLRKAVRVNTLKYSISEFKIFAKQIIGKFLLCHGVQKGF